MRLLFAALMTLALNNCAARKTADTSNVLGSDQVAETPVRGNVLFTCLSADKNSPSLKLVYAQDPIFRTSHLYSYKNDGSSMKPIKLGPGVNFGNEIGMSGSTKGDNLIVYTGGGAGLDAKLSITKNTKPNAVFETEAVNEKRVKGPGYNLKMNCDPISGIGKDIEPGNLSPGIE